MIEINAPNRHHRWRVYDVILLAIIVQLLASCRMHSDAFLQQNHRLSSEQLLETAARSLTDRNDVNVVMSHQVQYESSDHGAEQGRVQRSFTQHYRLVAGPCERLQLEHLNSAEFSALRDRVTHAVEGNGSDPDLSNDMMPSDPIVGFDGRHMYIVDPRRERYHRIEGVSSRHECLQQLHESVDLRRVVSWCILATYLLEIHPESESFQIVDVVDEGMVMLDGRPTRRLSFQLLFRRELADGGLEFESVDELSRTTIWIESSPYVRPVRIEQVLARRPSQPTIRWPTPDPDDAAGQAVARAVNETLEAIANTVQRTIITFDYQKFDQLGREPLQLDLAGMEAADSITALRSSGHDAPTVRAQEFLGRSIPTSALRQLTDGNGTDLLSERDEIIVLDFWATWCAPCVRALPVLIEVTEHYAERGVRLLAVNVGESESRVQRFLNDRDWNIDVLLDTDREVSTAFGIRALPTTVIVDRNGIVRAVHEGVSPQLHQILAAELDAILDDAQSSAESE